MSADTERLRRTREFFAPRAARWDSRFGDDLPAYARAVAEAGIPPGARVADVGCGTGRALPALRAAAGPEGVVLALDVTTEMLAVAATRARPAGAGGVAADALRLPLADGGMDAVFAAGLVHHLPDPAQGLRELARVTRSSGLLVLFHPSGRRALAARHGRELRPDEPLERAVLEPMLARTGWRLRDYDDADDRFHAVAARVA
jgi:ubiquinone/menaquinone biosynthesis C-methylase UbiE